MKLLVAEDEEELASALSAILSHAHYTVDVVDNGKDALDYALVGNYDGIILDIMMPQMEGTEVLRRMRAQHINTPVLFLTARSSTDDKITALDLGADDYLTKPFEMGELLARIRAMLRRREDFTPSTLTYGNVSLNRGNYEISTPDHSPVPLSGREFQMMEMLMESPGRIVSTDTFMDRIWADGEADTDVVWVYVSNLRKKLRTLEANIGIRSTRGLGYSVAML